MIYDILNEYVGLPQVDKVDAAKLEELLEELPANLMIQYLSDKPSYVQDLFLYLDTKENPSVEDVKNFFDQYVSGEEKVLRTYDDPDEAREFLMEMPEMKRLYKSAEKRRAAIDALDDDEVLERANEIIEEKRQAFEEERKKAIEEEKKRKQEQKKREREFWNTVNQVVEQLDWVESRKKRIKETWKPEVISEKWQTIIQNPEHFVQFVNVLTYYNDEEGFKELYELIDKKAATPKNQKKKEALKSKSLRDYLRSSKRTKRRSSKNNIEDFLE
ncbi:MAG: hypothetical protein D6711_10705 [Chloroflexi bacterium]|nr:MAG: hypothetical protein D6711_10705 [Chloroflexota bacterium]